MSAKKNDTKEAFESMWGLYPSPALLLRGNREIVAVNELARECGLSVGRKCYSYNDGRQSICPGCRGNKALKEKCGLSAGSWQPGVEKFLNTFWVPVKGEEDLFVHFGDDITEYVKEELCG